MGIKRGLALFVALIMMFGVVSAVPVFANDATQTGPILAEGNHMRWIDRIANLPDYAKDFYEWLGDNASVDGCLGDPTKAMDLNGAYVYHVTTITMSAAYSCSGNQTVGEAAKQAAVNNAQLQFQTLIAFLSDTYIAFTRDMPEAFWLNGQSRYGWTLSYEYPSHQSQGQVTYHMAVYFYLQAEDFDIRSNEYRDVEALTDAVAKCENDIDAILQGCPQNASTYEQVCYLNRVLTHTNSYNTSAGSAQSRDPWCCVSALDGRIGADGPVCEGYSKAFKVLCNRLGIDCVLVEGYAKGSKNEKTGAHMWNYVCVDGAWYAVDVTWNDPLVANRAPQAVSGYESEDWLLVGSDTPVGDGLSFIDSHLVSNNVYGGQTLNNGPMLSTRDYQPSVEDSPSDEFSCGVNGHNYESKVVYPTLTTNGYTTFTCKACGYSYRESYTFPDVPDSLWSYNAVEFAVAKGYFTGYKSGNFGPADNITRQDFVVVLARIAKVDLRQYAGRTGFPDVKAGDYYEAAVKWASSNGIVNGYKNGKFGVGDQITREQMVTILYNYARKYGYDVSVPESAKAKLSAYADADKISGYARTAVIWALYHGVVNGMTATTVAPQNSASRGQAATIFMNISRKQIMII